MEAIIPARVRSAAVARLRRLAPRGIERADLPLLLAVPGLAALVAEPALWLLRSWRDPSYQCDGLWVACGVLALALRSCCSGPARPEPSSRAAAWRLLLVAASLRLAGRLLAVHTIGALALVIDVAALGRLLGLARRPWAVSPGALAALAALALPVEHLAQRALAHPLQLAAAAAAHALLAPLFPGLEREGVRLLRGELALDVDLACSGARGLVLFAGVGLALACLRRATPALALAGAAAAALGALGANALRIALLFAGSAAQLPVLEEPWHGALGALALGLGCLPLLAVAARARPRCAAAGPPAPTPRAAPAPRRAVWALSAAVSALGVGISLVPERPLDVSSRELGGALPAQLGALRGEPLALGALEREYYARYGGSAQKRRYRDELGRSHTVLSIRTRSPLRHLHGPDRCLLGAGHRVTRIGVDAAVLPSVTYRSEAPDGSVWRVQASFASDAGERASDVSAVLWRWLARPGSAWNLVERITPWALCEADPAACREFDAALFASLDLSSPAPPLTARGDLR